MARKRKTADGAAAPDRPARLVWSPTAARGDVRKWRLHACGNARLNFPPDADRAWLRFIELAERHADGAATNQELADGRAEYAAAVKSDLDGVSGDFDLALYDSDTLARTWQTAVIDGRRRYTPKSRDYDLVLARFRVLEELVGPDPLPAFDPAWRTDTVLALARGMYAARAFAEMPILADAIQDAGCEDPLILDHCRDEWRSHLRGCWVLDLVLAGSNAPPQSDPEPPPETTRRPRGRRRR